METLVTNPSRVCGVIVASPGTAVSGTNLEKHLHAMNNVVLGAKGRLVAHDPARWIAVFESADAAVGAAIDIQEALDALPPVVGRKVWGRIGICYGPVEERDGGIAGNAVDIAAHLSQSISGFEILSVRETVLALAPLLKTLGMSRPRDNVQGVVAEDIYEIFWKLGDIEGPGSTIQ